ncbi:MAG: carbohydrate binding domain-containing protein [Oscillospiraceae bacterium]|nr:carbohydrate binding domain-containing protein [Oscillospiraceae bacterium]
MQNFEMKPLRKLFAGLTASAMMLSLAAVFPTGRASAADVCTIDTEKTYQTIQGFGGINHPEWTGQDLTPAQRQTAFGNGENELGFTVLRIFVNPDKNQWYKALPTAQAATQMGVTVFASPWEPPANLAESGGNNGKLHLPKSNYGAYAQHLNDFGNYMKENNVDLYAISVQNEPDYAHDWTYWSSDETTDFLANYGDRITSTRLMSPESFQYAPENASWVADGGKKFYSKILNNQKAMENCDLFGTHFYGTTRDWMDFPALENSGKQIWMTEVYVPNSEANSNERWPEAIQVAENIHNGLVVGNMSAYVWWYIRRSYGPMNEDGTISKRGYMMAHYSKYVRPGDVRIAATESPADNVYISAYKGADNQVTIVAVNKGSEGYAQQFAFSGNANITDVDRYRTTGSENHTLTANLENDGTSFWAQLPAESVTTFVVTMGEGSMTLPDGDPDDTGNTAPKPNEYGWYFHDEFEADTCTWEGRGAATVMTSGRTSYVGDEALLVQNRESAWNGAYRTLNPLAFVPGQEFSFSANVTYFDGEPTDTFYLKLQYTGADGETHYSTIAEVTGVKGEWAQLANKNYQIPEGASNMMLYVETAESTNNFYIDEAIGALPGTTIVGAGQPELPTETTPPSSETTPPVSVLKGDVDMNGAITAFDLAAAKKGLLRGFASDEASRAADVDENGTPTVTDLIQLTSFVLGRIDSFTTGGTRKDPEVENEISMAEYTAQIQAKMVETEPEAERTEKAGVTYGTLQKVSYYSNTCKRNRNFNILLPANYSTSKKYPVLYAMHGYWQNEDTLSSEEDESMRLRQIIGNAIAAGEAEDMIVVYPYIYASDTQDACSAMDDANNAAYDNFINELKNDLMPYIEANYSVLTGKDNTALTGFSMGGRESLYISNKMPDTFGYVGAICPAPGVSPGLIAESDFRYTNGSPYLLLLTAGSNDTVVYDSPAGYHNILTNNNVPHIWHYVNGGYHGGNCIRAHMYNFVRAAFKAN